MDSGPKMKLNGGKDSATLDEAMLCTGFGLYNIGHMLLSGLILMGVIMQCLVLGHALPAARCDLDLDTQLTGLLAAVPYAAIIITSYFWGWLADVRGRRPVMLYSMYISVITTIIASFAPDRISFAVLVFISSIFLACPTAVIYTFLGEFNNLRHRDKMVAFGSSFIGIGTVVLPAVSWLIIPLDFSFAIHFLAIEYRAWRLLLVACALPHLIGSILLYFFSDSPKFLHANGQEKECLDVLRTMYALNKFQPRDNFPIKSLIPEGPGRNESQGSSGCSAVLQSMKEQTAPLFSMPLVPWTCLTCFVQFGIFAATNGFFVWFPTILNAVANHDGGSSRICDIILEGKIKSSNKTLEVVACDDTINTSTFERSIYIGLVFTSMYFIVAFLVDFIGKKRILVVALVLTGIAGAASHLVPSNAAVVLFAIFQMSGACIGLMNAVAVSLFPTKYRALAVCMAMLVGRAGSMVGSYVIGMLLNTQCGLAFYVFGGLLIANGVLCLALPNDHKSPSEQVTQA